MVVRFAAATLGVLLFVTMVGGPVPARGAGASPAPLQRQVPDPADAGGDAAWLQGFLPKEDLDVAALQAERPDADGRGIVVAILDTGLDVGQPALQTTPDGGPKILDVFDATDNGFVPLPRVVSGADTHPRGLTGRVLTLPEDRPSGASVRLGIIIGRDLFPEGLHQRRQAERKAAWARLRESLAAEGGRPEPAASRKADAGTKEDAGDARASEAEYRAALADELERLATGDEDPGDRYDVAAIPRGQAWEIRIDRDADGDLAEEPALLPYSERRDVLRFGDPTQWSVAVDRIAPDGGSIFLFFDENGHGTHVAGIVAGWYGPGDPLNGLAPGAQLLGVKVGNGRMGGATSHDSIARAAQWAVDHGADVLNISFGGGSFFGDGNDPTAQFLDELVERTGVVICCSAGNAGPALSTVGSPATARRVFAWGASISRKTQQTNYGALDPRRDELFQFSSRGPLLDGDPGVDFIAPGAALSPLPTWQLVRGESWNGTSMASPQGAGFCACILSACRTDGIPASPQRLRRAMRMGARVLPGLPPIEQGDGMPQGRAVVAAMRTLAGAYTAAPGGRDGVVGWRVDVHNATGRGEGIYERDLRETAPYFVEAAVRPDLPVDSVQDARAAFFRIVALASDVAWMRAPERQSINANGTGIRVWIDPARLAPGLNVGRVVARDVAHPEAGPEFAIVATVVKAESVDPARPLREDTWSFERGDRRSLFVRVPEGARLARLRVRETLAETPNAYEIALAFPDLVRLSDRRGAEDRVVLAAGEERTLETPVSAGGVLEVAGYSRWHTNAAGRLELRLEFSGVEVETDRPVVIESDRPGAGFLVASPARGTRIRLDARIDARVEPLALAWTTERDSLFPGEMNGLPAVVHRGVGSIEAGDGEEIPIDLQCEPELEDFLDDAIFRVHDDSGREVARGFLSDGTCAFRAPHAGVFRIAFSLFARGGRIFDEARVIKPVVLRSEGPHPLRVHRDAYGGYTNGPDSLDAITLRAGERRRLFLRAKGLPGDALLRGKVTIHGEPSSDLYAEIPILADLRASGPGDPQGAVARVADAAVRRARLLARRSDLEDEDREAALDALVRCEALRRASIDADAEDDASRLEPLWDLREARAALLARHGTPEDLGQAIADLRESLGDGRGDAPADAAARREREAKLATHETVLGLRTDSIDRAREQLDHAIEAGGAGEATKRVEILLLAREGKHDACRKAAVTWLRAHPDDAEVDAALVRALIALGWGDLARVRLAGWSRRHPIRQVDALGLWADLDAAVGTQRPGAALVAFPEP